MSGPNLFARITKVDEARREVWGRLVQETPDRADEIFDYESSKPHFKAWSDAFAEATEGKSLGNLRAMHGKVAAGKFIAVDFNDADKAVDVGAKVVDEGEWTKVLEGVYTGFSIGGSYVGEKKTEKIGDKTLKRYTAKPFEGSLVDLPCIPTAKFFDIVKADGATVQKLFANAPADEPAPVDVKGTPEQIAALGKLLNDAGMTLEDALALLEVEALHRTIEDMTKREFSADERKAAAKEGAALPDGSFPIKTVGDLKNAVQAYGRAKDKAKAKAHIIARAKALGATKELPEAWTKGEEKAAGGEVKKGLWNVANFAQALESLSSIAHSAQYDLEAEGDASPVPMKLRNWVDDGIAIFKEMADEEAGEMLAELKTRAGVGEDDEIEQAVEAAARVAALRKRLASPELPVVDLVKIAAEHGEPVTTAALSDVPALIERIVAKASAKLSAMDADHLQAAHDHMAALGAKCAAPDEKAAGGELHKGADNAEIVQLRERVAQLERQPMPSIVTLRLAKAKPLTKEQDSLAGVTAPAAIDPETVELGPNDPLVRNADGSVDYRSSRLMKARRLAREQAPGR